MIETIKQRHSAIEFIQIQNIAREMYRDNIIGYFSIAECYQIAENKVNKGEI